MKVDGKKTWILVLGFGAMFTILFGMDKMAADVYGQLMTVIFGVWGIREMGDKNLLPFSKSKGE